MKIKVEQGSGNVYADIGSADAEAMLLKAQLAARIGQIIGQRGWTQEHAAEVVGMPRPKLSNLLRGQFRGISEAKMLECLTRLGSNVHIVIDPADNRAPGRIDVVMV